MQKKLMEKNDYIVKQNGELCEIKVENANLKKEIVEKESNRMIQFHIELADAKDENINLKKEMQKKDRDIEQFKHKIRILEDERFCSDLIQLDDSTELTNSGLYMNDCMNIRI